MKIQKNIWIFSIVLLMPCWLPLYAAAQDCKSFHTEFFKLYYFPPASSENYKFSDADMEKCNAIIKALGVQHDDTLKCYGGQILYEWRYSNADNFHDATRVVVDLVIKDAQGYVLFFINSRYKPAYTKIYTFKNTLSVVPEDAKRPGQALQAAFALLKINN